MNIIELPNNCFFNAETFCNLTFTPVHKDPLFESIEPAKVRIDTEKESYSYSFESDDAAVSFINDIKEKLTNQKIDW